MSYNANIKREWGEILGYCTIQNIPIPSMFGTETPIIIQKPVTSFFQFLALFLDVFMAATYILWFHSGGRVGILIITWLISHFPGSATSIIIPNLALLPGYSLISFVLKRDQSKKQVVYVWVYYTSKDVPVPLTLGIGIPMAILKLLANFESPGFIFWRVMYTGDRWIFILLWNILHAKALTFCWLCLLFCSLCYIVRRPPPSPQLWTT